MYGAASAAVPDYATLICHRGESVDAPENTLPAYQMAVSRGFGFECDIYLSADKRVFTFHDSTLERTTGGANTKSCAEANWAGEIENLDVGSWGQWAGSQYAGTRPALLEEVLELAVDGRYIYVEVKPESEIVPYIKEIFDAQTNATPANTLFISFKESSCKALKQQMPEYKVYWLKSGNMTAESLISKLQSLGVDGVDYCYNASITTPEFISAVRAAGFEFHVWTIDDLPTTLEAFARGAQTVTTNCGKALRDEYQAILAEQRALRPICPYDVGDYVQDGLVLHLDGIRNAGADAEHSNAATEWTDLARGSTASILRSGADTSDWTENGYYFGGGSHAELSDQISLTNTVTVQVVCNVDTNVQTATWPTLAGAGNADACNLYYARKDNDNRMTFKNANGGHCRMPKDTWEGRYVTAIRNGTVNRITQGATISASDPSSTAASANIGTQTWRVGSAKGSGNGLAARYLNGTVHAVRVYDRALSNEELAWNRAIDEARFFGAGMLRTNVIVRTSLRGAEGNEVSGNYLIASIGYTFSAPESVTIGADEYVCAGYTLETWDDATGVWGVPVSYESCSCTLSDTTAKTRLTWQWTHTAGPGYDAAFNDYVSDGLILHLDGIRNAGISAGHDCAAEEWADLCRDGEGATFVTNDTASGWTRDGFFFGGSSHAVMKTTRTIGTAFTIQVTSDIDTYALRRSLQKWPGILGTTAANDPLVMFVDQNNNSVGGVKFKANNAHTGVVISNWSGEYATAWSDGSYASLFDSVTPATTKEFSHAAGTRTITIGGGNGGGGYEPRYLTGTIKSLRIYNRPLSNAELARNRAVDEARFFARSPAAASGELIVVSTVDGLAGDLPAGTYRPADGYVFTAPAEATLDGTSYELTGCTLETWDADEGVWGAPVPYESCSCTVAASTASRRLTWQWRVKSRLTRVRDDYDVGDYVQDGLYLHLDGIRNVGATVEHDSASTVWANLGTAGAGFNAVFDYANGATSRWTTTGYDFVYGGAFARLATIPDFGDSVTIQLVCEISDKGSATWPTLFGATNDFCNIYSHGASSILFKIFNNAGNSMGGRMENSNWNDQYVNAIWHHGYYTIFDSVTPLATNWSGVMFHVTSPFSERPFYIGGVYFETGNNPASDTNRRRLNGTVHALRVYKRVLSDTELIHNREVDEARFRNNPPASNVTLAQGRFDTTAEIPGSYRVEGTYTFTAQPATINGATYHAAGYTLETWDEDEGVWSDAAYHSGSAYTYTESSSPAKVRLTWHWQGDGTVLIIR